MPDPQIGERVLVYPDPSRRPRRDPTGRHIRPEGESLRWTPWLAGLLAEGTIHLTNPTPASAPPASAPPRE